MGREARVGDGRPLQNEERGLEEGGQREKALGKRMVFPKGTLCCR